MALTDFFSSQPAYRDRLREKQNEVSRRKTQAVEERRLDEERQQEERTPSEQVALRRQYQLSTPNLQRFEGSGPRIREGLDYEGLSSTRSPLTIDKLKAGGQHPVLQLTSNLPGAGVGHSVQLALFHALREAIPDLDRSIGLRREIEGELVVEAEDDATQDLVEDFAENVPVGFISGETPVTGVNAYVDLLADRSDEYGMAAGERLLTENEDGIARLLVPDSRTLFLRAEEETRPNGQPRYELYQRLENGGKQRASGPRVDLLAFRPPAEGHWPAPMVWGCDFMGELFLRIFTSMVNAYWRYGDPSQLFQVALDPEASVSTDQSGMPDVVSELQARVDEAMQARLRGDVADVHIGIKGGKVERDVLGDPAESLADYVTDHYTVIVSQIIGKANVPSFLFPGFDLPGGGIGAERYQTEARLCSGAAARRRTRKEKIARAVIDEHLVLSGNARAVDRYELRTEAASIEDENLEEETRQASANADQVILDNASVLDSMGAFEDEDEKLNYIRSQGVQV